MRGQEPLLNEKAYAMLDGIKSLIGGMPDRDDGWSRSAGISCHGRRLMLDGEKRCELDLVPVPATATKPLTDESAAIVLNWPNYSGANPYQQLLYSVNTIGVKYYFGRIEQAIKLLESNLVSVPVVFHLHWLQWLFNDAHSPLEAHRRASVYVAKLSRFKDLGGRLLWTIHNEMSHEARYAQAERFLSVQIARLADSIHVHDFQSLDEIRAFDVPRHKVIEFPHGHYLGVYADVTSRAEAREILNLSEQDDVCLFLGQIREYKGIQELITAFRSIWKERPSLKLLVVGGGRHDPFADLEEPLSMEELQAIHTHRRFVEDDELQTFYRAADFSILPYRKVLTSGSLMLSLSFRIPVAVADNAMTRNVMASGDFGGIIADPGAADQIAVAMLDLLARKDAGTLTVSPESSANFAKEYEWRDFSVEVIKPLIEASVPSGGLRARLKGTALARNVSVGEYSVLAASEHFDPEEFARRHPRLCAAARDPAAGYLQYAARTKCRPNAEFDPEFYTSFFADAAVSDIDPFLHYLEFTEGSRPANAAEQLAMIEAFSARNLTPWEPGPTGARLCIFFSDPDSSSETCMRSVAAALDVVRGANRIHLVLGAVRGLVPVIQRGFQSEITDRRLTLHEERQAEGPLFSAVSVACGFSSGGPIVFLDGCRGDGDASSAIQQAQCMAPRVPFIFLADPSDPHGHVFTITKDLLDCFSLAYPPMNEAHLPNLITARVRQACPAIPVLGPIAKDPQLGLGSAAHFILSQADVAHVTTAQTSKSQRLLRSAWEKDVECALFDLSDALVDGIRNAAAKRHIKKENVRSRTAYVSLNREEFCLEDHFQLMSGPAERLPGEGTIVFSCVKNDDQFLSAFIDHYRGIGAAHIVIIDDHSSRGVHLDHSAPDVSVLRPKSGRFFTSKTLWLELLIRHYSRFGAWVVTADSDEFLDLPTGYEGLPDIVHALDQAESSFLPCLLLDMLPDDERDYSADADFSAILNQICWETGPATAAYECHNTVKWGFGRFARLSWQVDARYHIFGTVDCLRKVSLFRNRSGIHLNQGFHTLIDRMGMNHVSPDAWVAGPVGFVRHYKFTKFLSLVGRVGAEQLHGVYFEETARNLVAAFRRGPSEILSDIRKMERTHYSIPTMETLVQDMRDLARAAILRTE